MWKTPQSSGHRDNRGRTYISSCASGAVIYRGLPEGVIEFLLIPYTIRGEKTLRCIMGGRDSKNESPAETLSREVGQEAVDTLKAPFYCEFAENPILITELVPDETDSGGFHLKVFQLVKLIKGVLRTKDLIDDSGRYPELLGPPEWIEAEEAIRRMSSERGSKWIHIQAVKTGLVSLMSRDRNICGRYAHVARELCDGVEVKMPSPMVAQYLKRFDIP